MIRRFRISAIQTQIVYNAHGDHDPGGLLFVLEEDEEMIKVRTREIYTSPVEAVQPLIIRACQGEAVELIFTNKLELEISICFNEVSKKLRPGASRTFTLDATKQGALLYTGALCVEHGEEIARNHGLFGVLIVEPPGATWTHPETGIALECGTAADIHNMLLPDFREFVVFIHGEIPIRDRGQNLPVNPLTGLPDRTFAINYRSEPFRNRLTLINSGKASGIGSEVYYDSWVFGDPATPVFRAYKGDPVRFYVINMSSDAHHAFHLHGHRCLPAQGVSAGESALFDTMLLDPLETVVFDLMHGAGDLCSAFGDFLFHCCLYTHSYEGTWGILRVHDVLEEGKDRFYPDGTPIPALVPLPDREVPSEPTRRKPGFPLFVPGTFGERAPLSPYGFGREFDVTDLEKNVLSQNALYTSDRSRVPMRRVDMVAMEVPVLYNKEGWFDPEGRVFVLAEDEQLIRTGKKPIEPLVIRANAGECVEIRLTNKLPDRIGGTPFHLLEETPYCSLHVRGLVMDVPFSDGANCGWNYFCGIPSGGQGTYLCLAASPTIALFYDHLFGTGNQHHGLFGMLVVEPSGSRYSCPFTGKPLFSGSQAAIEHPFLPSFREYCVIMNRFAPVFDRNLRSINPPEIPGQLVDSGIAAYNYRNEPLIFRRGDPAYVLSSWVHGDPETPVFQGYAGDPVKFCYASFCDQGFPAISGKPLPVNGNLVQDTGGVNLIQFPADRNSFIGESTVGLNASIGSMGGYFEFALGDSGNDDFDILYRSRRHQDFLNGLWGLIRVRGRRVPFLRTLGGRKPLPDRVMPLPEPTGRSPMRALSSGKSVPRGTPVRRYHIAAIQHPILYNSHKDHDPLGILFVPFHMVEDVYRGRYNPEPLIIRANAGDCVEVTLTNLLPTTMPGGLNPLGGDLVFSQYPPRVSLHANGLRYDVLGSDGATVGFNPDQTIGPGETITYRWYVDGAHGENINLCDYGNVFYHEYHGLFGALIVEPVGSSWQGRRIQGSKGAAGGLYGAPHSESHGELYRQLHSELTHEPYSHFYDELNRGLDSELLSEVRVMNPFMPTVREIVVIQHDCGLLIDREGVLLSPLVSSSVSPFAPAYTGGVFAAAFTNALYSDMLQDFYATGFEGMVKAVNYRAEPLLKGLGRKNKPFVSWLDVKEVIQQTYPGEPVVVRWLERSPGLTQKTFFVFR